MDRRGRFSAGALRVTGDAPARRALPLRWDANGFATLPFSWRVRLGPREAAFGATAFFRGAGPAGAFVLAVRADVRGGDFRAGAFLAGLAPTGFPTAAFFAFLLGVADVRVDERAARVAPLDAFLAPAGFFFLAPPVERVAPPRRLAVERVVARGALRLAIALSSAYLDS